MTHHVRHPWSMVSLKRKRPELDEANNANTLKRLRANTLEHGFAHLNIEKQTSPTEYVHEHQPTSYSSPPLMPEVDMADEPSSPEDVSGSTTVDNTVHLPTSVEEPKKKVPWYEPEKDRVVITDLDAVESEDEQESKDDDAQFEISPALLRHLKQQPPSIPSPKEKETMALILFKPPPSFTPEQPQEKRPPVKEEEDVVMMDVE